MCVVIMSGVCVCSAIAFKIETFNGHPHTVEGELCRCEHIYPRTHTDNHLIFVQDNRLHRCCSCACSDIDHSRTTRMCGTLIVSQRPPRRRTKSIFDDNVRMWKVRVIGACVSVSVCPHLTGHTHCSGIVCVYITMSLLQGSSIWD